MVTELMIASHLLASRAVKIEANGFWANNGVRPNSLATLIPTSARYPTGFLKGREISAGCSISEQ